MGNCTFTTSETWGFRGILSGRICRGLLAGWQVLAKVDMAKEREGLELWLVGRPINIRLYGVIPRRLTVLCGVGVPAQQSGVLAVPIKVVEIHLHSSTAPWRPGDCRPMSTITRMSQTKL